MCTYLLQMKLPAARKMFCIFCSQFQGELFDMQRQQQASKKKTGTRKEMGQRI
jgi:ribosomal protein L44E